MRSVFILGVRIDDVTHDDVRALFLRWLAEDGQRVVVTPNPEFIVQAQRDETFRHCLNASDLALPDGVGLKVAAPSLHRVTGVDALQMLRELAVRPVTIGNAAADVDAGPVSGTLAPEVVERVRAMSPDVIAIGLGQGKQEAVIAAHRAQWPSAKIIIGVGGAIDMLAGRQRRAPRLLQRLGLEWLWRLTTQPWRLRRIVNAVIVFPTLVFRAKFL